MSDRDATSAWRRRQRRLRAQWRHEQQTVAMVLAMVTHHSFQVGTAHDGLRAQRTVTSAREGEARAPHDALRGQKRPPLGMRPGVLLDPAPQWGADTVGYVAAPVPHLALPVLAGGDGLDGAALDFLVRQAVLAQRMEEEAAVVQRKEEEAARRRKVGLQAAREAKEWVELVDEDGKTYCWNSRLQATSLTRPGSSSSTAMQQEVVKRRKKKKRRRKRTRRTSWRRSWCR